VSDFSEKIMTHKTEGGEKRETKNEDKKQPTKKVKLQTTNICEVCMLFLVFFFWSVSIKF